MAKKKQTPKNSRQGHFPLDQLQRSEANQLFESITEEVLFDTNPLFRHAPLASERSVLATERLPPFISAQEAQKRGLGNNELKLALLFEKVIGQDERAQVPTTTIAPFSAICHLEFSFGTQLFAGTGWLVAPRLVVTCAHNLWPLSRRRFCDKMTIMRARNVNPIPGQTQVVELDRTNQRRSFCINSKWISPGLTESQERAYDYGAIILPEPFSGHNGFFGFEPYSDAELLAMGKANIVGYPSERNVDDDKPYGTQWGHALTLSQIGIHPRYLAYQIDTSQGNSGSPTFDVIPGASGQPTRYNAVGIHRGSSTNNPENHATRITESVAQAIDQFIAASQS